MLAQSRWSRGQWGLFALLAVASFYLVWLGADTFWHLYPYSYVWSEALLSYQGGFVRRGLLGELAYQAAPWVHPRRLVVYLTGLLYIAVFLRVIALVIGRLNLPAILFLLSPIGLIFPLLDKFAFGRKDVILLAGFLLSLALIRWLRRWPFAGLLAAMAIFLVTGLTHETAWAYFPLAVAYAVHMAARDRAPGCVWGMAAASAGYMLAMLVLIYLIRGNPEASVGIMAAWNAFEPDLYSGSGGAAGYLGADLGGAWNSVVSNLRSWQPWVGYGLAAFLGFAVIAAYTRRVRPLWRRDLAGRASLAIAALALLAPLLLAADWGRYVYMACLQVFVVVASMDHAPDDAPADRARLPLALAIALVLTYSATWRVVHWVDKEMPLKPGYLFDLLAG
jgi:hypothetical protein